MDRLVTFDCFDTVLTRAVGAPSSVAYVLAARLRAAGAVDVDAEVFVEARRRAEALVFRRAGDGHVLADVARQLADLLGLDPAAAEVLERAELEVERELSRPVPAAVAEVHRVRATGAQVGFLSDTPLPHDVVADLLRRAGAMRDGDLLWVSNELRAGKGRGTAYFEVARRWGGPRRQWRHVGDDARSDGRMARLSGVRSQLEPRARLDRYERLLSDAAPASGGFSSLLAGASRRTRLRLEVERPDLAPARVAVAAGVSAPLLVGYVLWALRRAQRAGCRRVVFMARDGEVMLAVARQLAGPLGLDLDLRYLEGSRRAWLLPSMAEVDRGRLAAVLGREERPTVRSCLSWLDLGPEQLPDALAAVGLPAGSWDARLDAAGLERLLDVLDDAQVRDLVTAAAEDRSAAVRDYLRQEGLLDGEPYAVVDIGWQGTVGRLLTALVARHGGRPPAVECYVGLTLPSHDAPDRDPAGWLFDDWRGTGPGHRFPDLWVAMEVFCAATHGRVEGYARVDGEVKAVHAADRHAAALAWGLEGVRRAVEVFCEELGPVLRLLDPGADVRGPVYAALRAFWVHPTPAEVAAWGDFPFEADAETYALTTGLSPREVARSVVRGRPRTRRRGTWPAGADMVSPRPVRLAKGAAGRARTVAGKAGRVRHFVAGRRAGTPLLPR